MKKFYPKRRRHAHGVFNDFQKSPIVFVTVSTRNRQPWLDNPNVHKLLRAIWTEATAWITGRYMILPNHLHLFAAPTGSKISLDKWIQYWKSQFSKRHENPDHRWQSGHWDTRLRRSDSYDSKWWYVMNNPVRHKLVSKAEIWPYQGEIFCLPWED